MRKIIAALQVSVDGYVEGSAGEIDWIRSWEDPFELLDEIDTCLLGGTMYPGYEQYWSAVQRSPLAPLPFTGRAPTAGEIRYARFAAATPHFVLSATLREVSWRNTSLVRDLDAIRRLKALPGRNMHAVGGAAFVASLLNAGLVDELRLAVHPVVLSAGKPLFGNVNDRRHLRLTSAKPLAEGAMLLAYDVEAVAIGASPPDWTRRSAA